MKIKEKVTIQYKKNFYLDLKPISTIYPDIILEEDLLVLGNFNSQFSVFITVKELEKEDFWKFVSLFFHINIIKIAKWWNQYVSDLDPKGFFLSRNWSDNYKTRSDWEEWKQLSKNSEIFYELYDFPLQIIRLWDRFSEEIQTIWLKILEIVFIKKNLMREIILDLYDLPYEKQIKISSESLNYIRNLKEKNLITIETQEIIRENIKKERYPLFYNNKKESYFLKKKIESLINLKNFEIILPEDLESKPIELKIYLFKEKDLESFLEKLSEPSVKKNLNELISKVLNIL